jgi:hypothetical protein
MRLLPFMMLLVAGSSACKGDVFITDDFPPPGAGDAPSLETPTKTDKIVQVTKPEVDVLWIVDNSCSMIEEQQKLTESFPKFINFFLNSGLDWHIGVVSTDVSDDRQNGKLQGAGGYKFITPEVSNPVAVFAVMASLGTGGSSTEEGLLAAFRALTAPTPGIQDTNRGFYRESASLHIVTISDEEDQSAPRITRNEFVTFLQDLKPDAETPVTFSSIVGPTPNGCHSPDADAVPGSIYIAVTNAIGGVFRSICEEDWDPVLEELGLQAAGLRREYFLSELPVPGTVEVWVVDGDVQYDGLNQADIPPSSSVPEQCTQLGKTNCFPYAYDNIRNSILMTDFVPSPLAEINIKYDLLSGLQPGSDVIVPGGGGADTAAP